MNPSPTTALDRIIRRGGVHTKLLKSTDREDFWLVELCVRSLAPRPNVTNTLSITAIRGGRLYEAPSGRGLRHRRWRSLRM